MKCFEQSRDMIFEVAGLLSDNEGFDFYQTWVVDMLKYFSTDELKDFFNDYARLRDFSINWNDGTLVYDE
tara:strand:+ start:1392 stop:1601 length:210 start_codon:yes stop_codon:yes gene_type:complete